jgi:SAM-dependent methyltransferase
VSVTGRFKREDRHRRADSFSAVAGAYERGRPSYPVDAIRWLVGTAPLEVVDLGAGSGKLTRQLVAEGHHVVAAVEPLPELRAELERSAPGVPALDGSAEKIPLPDACANAVAVAQAFHWFRLDEALPEIARILRPGGVLVLIWNRSDESVAWVKEFSRLYRRRRVLRRVRARARRLARRAGRLVPMRLKLIGGEQPHTGWRRPLEASPLFAGLERRTFSHEQRLDLDGLLDLVSSKSYAASRTPRGRDRLRSRIERLWEEHPELADREEVTLPYHADAFKCWRTDLDQASHTEAMGDRDWRKA